MSADTDTRVVRSVPQPEINTDGDNKVLYSVMIG